jgi:hypothetical protein
MSNREQYQREQHHRDRTPPGERRGSSWLGRFLGFVAIVFLTYLGIRYLAYDRLDEEIRSRIEAKFRDHYHGLTVSVRSARRVPGHGIEVHGLMIAHANHKSGEPPMLYIDEMLAECETDLTHFLTHPPQIKSLVVRQVSINAERFETGFWNVRHLFPVPPSGGRSPPIKVIGGNVRIVDRSQGNRQPISLRDLQFDLHEDARLAEAVGLPADLRDGKGRAIRPPLQVRGKISGDHVERVAVRGAFDPRRGMFHIEGEIEDLNISPKLIDGLPRDVADELKDLPDVRGRVSCIWRVHNVVAQGESPKFEVRGNVADGRVDHAKLLYPVTDIAADFLATEKGIEVTNLSARFGSADFRAKIQSEGYAPDSPVRIDLHTDGLSWTADLVKALPEKSVQMWKAFRPEGTFSGDWSLVFDGETWKPEGKLKATNLSFAYRDFAYSVRDGEAEVELADDRLTIVGTAQSSGVPISFEGEIDHPGEGWHGWGEVHASDPIPIDDRLIAAFKPTSQDVIRRFEPSGHAKMEARIERSESGKLSTDYNVELVNCSIRYRDFRYPVQNVCGKFRVINGVWTIEKLTGSNDSARIECKGKFGPSPAPFKQAARGAQDQLLDLDFTVRDLVFEPELHQALTPSGRQLWEDFKPQGQIDLLRTKLRWRPGEKDVRLDVDAYKTTPRSASDSHAIQVKPTWFPYSMAIHRGQVHYSQGVLTFKDIEATHGRTTIGVEGDCAVGGDEGWTVRLDKITASQLEIDHDLLSALPTDAGRAMSQAKLLGKVGVDGNAMVKRLGAAQGPIDAQWDLHFDVQDGRVEAALPISNIQGGIQLVGAATKGRWQAQGDVNIDSMMVKEVQVTEVRGPIHVDADRFLIGTEADRDQAGGQPRRMTAQIFEGMALVDGEMSLREDGKFQFGLSLEEANLAAMSREFSNSDNEFTGRVFSQLNMTGTTRGKHSWRGSGKVSMRDADLYQVPAMLAVVKLLSTRQTNSSTFNACDVDFHLTGDDVIFDRINISGDVLSLKGYGQLLVEQRTVDVSLYTQVGNEDLRSALWRPFGDSGTSILLIEMKGRVDKPEVKKTAFPAINETLARLFPELDRQQRSGTTQDESPPDPPAAPQSTGPRLGSGIWKRTQGIFRR